MRRPRRAWPLLLALAVAEAACSFPDRTPTPNLAPAGASRTWATSTPFRPLAPTATAAQAATLIPTREWLAPYSLGNATPAATQLPGPVDPFPFTSEAVNILLIGSDTRTGTSYRTDTLIVLSIDPGAGAAALLSIPRDLYVYLPGYGMQRVNAALMLGDAYSYPGGGEAMLADTLLYNLGIPIHHFALIEMSAFQEMIDALGGVEVDVSCPYTDFRLRRPDLSPDEEDNWALFTVPTGVVQMDGNYALWYARARHRSSDFDRARRQQEVLRAIYDQVLSLGLIPRLPSLYGDLTDMVSTDLSLRDLLDLALLAPRLDPAQIRSRFIGRDQVIPWRVPGSGAQVLLPNPPAIRALLEATLHFNAPDPLVPEIFPTIEVVNLSSYRDWDHLAASRLSYAGYRTHITSADPEPGASTQLVDHGLATEENRQQLLALLGLGSGALATQNDPTSPFLFTLRLGDDYQPCFDPTRNQGS